MSKLTPKDLAQRLNGRQYRSEITIEEAEKAKEAGLVVVYGYKDDNVEFEGTIREEVSCWEGVTIFLTPKGILEACWNECAHYLKAKETAIPLRAIWNDNGEYAWTFEAPFPHETFEIFEEGEKFCRGIVFALADVGKKTLNLPQEA